MQSQLETWREAADRNKLPRLNWKDYLGISLNQYVAAEYATTHSATRIEEKIYAVACQAGIRYTVDEDRARHLIHIGVGARIAEMCSEKTIIKTKRGESLEWRGRVHEFSNGTKALFIPKEVQLKGNEFVYCRANRLEG